MSVSRPPSPSSPGALSVKATSLLTPALETDMVPFSTWFLTRHLSCEFFKDLCAHGASLLSLVSVRGRRAD